MPSVCFPLFGLFYRTNEGNRGSCIAMRDIYVEMSKEVVHRWLFAPHGGGRRRRAHKLPGSFHAWFKKLEGCLYALRVFPIIRLVLQDQ